jgi:hypothetical protein
LGQPAHIVEILFFGIGPDIDIAELVVTDVGNEPREVVEAVIDDAERAASKGRVAPRASSGAISSISTRAPFSRADSAAQVAALPAPTTMTSRSSLPGISMA